MTTADSSYVSASDLADYAYCPRSYWYRYHPPPGGPSEDGMRRSEAGTQAHRRQLGGERRRAGHGGLYWVLAALGVLAAIGGVLWLR
jgi:CRISPR/Cas system-associated exonuclease Cas4 (RecB family)